MEMTLLCIFAFVWVIALAVWVMMLIRKINAGANQLETYKAEALRLQTQLDAEQKYYEKTLATLREDHEKVLKQQLEGVKAELAAENAKVQKANEESLKKEAMESFKTVTGGLDEQIKLMKESFDAQKKEHTESTAAIKTQFEATAKSLIQQTNEVTKGAEHLAEALRGRNKMQGCMGETLLENIFLQEGMVPGRDFDREVTLRDAAGLVVKNEDLGTRMRPDFILHFPDNTDVIVDSKVSLSALADYFSAESDDERELAAKRNYDSVISHIKELTGKEYQKYNAGNGRKTLGYVMMFIPNYGAFQLAKQINPSLFSEAFKQNVLITTEETIMPFLRIIRSAWVNQEQIANQQKIIDAAQKMVERVAAFYTENQKMGKKLKEALETYETNAKKLEVGGQSIVHAANEAIMLGVPRPKKALPDTAGALPDAAESGPED